MSILWWTARTTHIVHTTRTTKLAEAPLRLIKNRQRTDRTQQGVCAPIRGWIARGTSPPLAHPPVWTRLLTPQMLLIILLFQFCFSSIDGSATYGHSGYIWHGEWYGRQFYHICTLHNAVLRTDLQPSSKHWRRWPSTFAGHTMINT